MVGILLFLVFGFATFALLFFPNPMTWLQAFKDFVQGGIPIATALIAVISLFIGINDIKDASARKKELALEEEKEGEVEEVKKEEEKKEEEK